MMNRPLDNTVPRVHHSISAEGRPMEATSWNEITAKDLDRASTRALALCHLLRRKKRRYLMTQVGRGIVA